MRLTEKYNDGKAKGIMVRESNEKDSMKTLFQKFDNVEGYYGSCDEGYCGMEKLLHYENAEEDGRLLNLPCKIPSTVFVIDYSKLYIRPERVSKLTITQDGIYLKTDVSEYSINAFKKLAFNTYDEAFDALEKFKKKC